MPQTRKRYVAKARNQDTGELVSFVAPPETTVAPSPGDAGHFLAWLWAVYTGSPALTNCVLPEGPIAGAPTWLWDNDDIPPLIPGEILALTVPLTALTPGSGEHMVETGVVSKPDWLSATYAEFGVEVRLYGKIPASGELNMRLYGKQSGSAGLRTNQSFRKVISAPSSFYALSLYRTITKRLTIEVGADGVGVPTITLLSAPSGYDKGMATLMDRLATPDSINNLPYPFAFNYFNIITGQYIGRIDWLNQTRYFTLKVVDKENLPTATLALSSSVTLPQPGVPIYDGTKEVVADTPGVNPAPILINPQPDVPITAAGPFTIPPPANEFSDNAGDSKRLFGYLYNGGTQREEALPVGITFDPETGVFYGTADFANRDFVLRRKYVDSADQFAVDDFLVTVRRGSPIVTRIINNISIVEGRQGVVQLYDVHADGSWTEVTQSDGVFEIADAQYPDGMGISYGNTGRALVATKLNSVSQDVPVNVRYRPASGSAITGVVTILNAISSITTRIINNISVTEGSQGTVQLYDVHDDGSWTEVTQSDGVFEFAQAQYPDGMTLSFASNGRATVSTAANSILENVPVKVRYRSASGSVVEGVVTVINQPSASSPVTGQIINNISIIEGGQGIVQVYDVHADGSFTEVTQANGSSFQFIGNYPDGMALSFTNTGRALVQTRTNSVTDTVPVNVRFTYAGGQVVNGVVTVLNQASSTPGTTTPDPRPAVEKFAVRITQQSSNLYLIHILIKVTNLPAGTTMEFNYPEFFQRTNTANRFSGAVIKSDSSEFPDGFKDYNAFYGLWHMPVSLTQTHSVQHIKVRQQGSIDLLLDTTFDPFGMVNGQTKQFFPTT